MKLAALARTLPTPTTVTLSDLEPGPPRCCSSEPVDQSKSLDVVVYPDGFYAKGMDSQGIDSLIHRLRQTEKDNDNPNESPTDRQQKPLQLATRHLVDPSHTSIFVCTHGSRDSRCGIRGNILLTLLRDEIEKQELGKRISAWRTSHIGGHKYAANIIVYPHGDWYGFLEPTRETVIKLLSCLVEREVWWEKWRGALNLTKKQQINLWTKQMYHISACQDINNVNSQDDIAWQPKVGN